MRAALANIKLKQLAGDALRFLLVFLLAFALTFGVELRAFAANETGGDAGSEQPAEGDDEGGAGNPDNTGANNAGAGGDSGGGADTGGGETPDPAPTINIEGITLYYETPYVGTGWKTASNSWEEMPAEHGAITSKGGSLAFRVQLVFGDGSTADANADNPVTWSVSDPAVASISSSGVLMALANGTVTVTASVGDISTSYAMDISGQNNELFVSAIAIVNGEHQSYDEVSGGYAPQLTNLSDQTLQLIARVTVTDPATGAATDYYTDAGSLSSQTGGAIADVSWSVNDSLLGAVEASTGEYRPVDYGNVLVSCTSNAGLGGAAVTGSVWAVTVSEHKQDGGNRPQSSLTVRVYYEDVPDQIVSEKTFTRDEIEAMGTEKHTYTCIGGTAGFATASGRGVLFSKVLEEAGANLKGISYFSFVTADSGKGVFGETVSYNMLLGTERYYFRSYDIGITNDDYEVVPPMLAIESNFRWWTPNSSIDPDYDTMTDGTCFRLLFGATASGQNTTSKQIYWINTINVVLAGGPPTDNGDGNEPNNDGNNNGDGGPSNGSGSGDGDGTGSGSGAGDAQGSDNGTPEGTGAAPESEEPTGLAAPAAQGGGGGSAKSEGKWTVYQVMNPNASNVAALDFDNPYAPYVAPAAVGIAAAGGVQMAVRYRRQKQPIRKTAP